MNSAVMRTQHARKKLHRAPVRVIKISKQKFLPQIFIEQMIILIKNMDNV